MYNPFLLINPTNIASNKSEIMRLGLMIIHSSNHIDNRSKDVTIITDSTWRLKQGLKVFAAALDDRGDDDIIELGLLVFFVLATEGLDDGVKDLDGMSTCDGIDVGISDEIIDGTIDGKVVSFTVGLVDGPADGLELSFKLGNTDGLLVGRNEGRNDGSSVG
mmetsp:Transcript_22513/g.34555  ORF Transcript_22513/g.34555 Transcript_22513/m.34555 type:complete len:162 (+) Transcript_22513:2397-2882(+)